MAVVDRARAEYEDIASKVGTADRKAFAMLAKASPNAKLLFGLLDGRDISPMVWRHLRPDELEYPPLGGGDDAEAAS